MDYLHNFDNEAERDREGEEDEEEGEEGDEVCADPWTLLAGLTKIYHFY